MSIHQCASLRVIPATFFPPECPQSFARGFVPPRPTPELPPLPSAPQVPLLPLDSVSTDIPAADEGPQALAEARTLVEEERYWEAEVARLRGVFLLWQTGTSQAEAETWLGRAFEVSRHQEATSLELRAAMSLSRLWQQQGKRDQARELLAPIYDRFTEGFDSADLREAKARLEALS